MDHSEVKHLQKVDHTPAELDEESKLLLRAAAFLDDRPWGNGNNGTSCAYIAMVHADAPNSISTPLATRAGYRFAAAIGADTIIGIFHWNDSLGRTKDEVVAKLRAVALGL